MIYDRDKLYRLLPEIHRLRDRDGALEALVGVLAEQAEVLEEDVRRLYDDLFIETCADWVVPYIGDLLGVSPVHALANLPGDSAELRGLRRVLAPRAQVANTLRLRQMKGTAAALEQFASDVTGWRARVVELFRQVAVSAQLNHPRAGFGTANLRAALREPVGSAFDLVGKSVDVRPMGDRPRPHIPNVAVFLFRLRAQERARWTATPVAALGPRHFRLSALGADAALYHRELLEPALAHLAGREHVPGPIVPAAMDAQLDAYYGRNRSVLIHVDGVDVLPAPGQSLRDLIEVCDLGDAAGAWGFAPSTRYRLDPRRGRLLTPAQLPPPARIEVTFHEGVAADLGGGPYDRSATTRAPADRAILAPAEPLDRDRRGVVELTVPGPYVVAQEIQVAAGELLELRAADGVFAQLRAQPAPLRIRGLGPGAAVVVSGVRLQGWLEVVGEVAEVTLRDTTLVPGRTVDASGAPVSPGQPSLRIDAGGQTRVRLERCITGPLALGPGTSLRLDASLVDAGDPATLAIGGLDGVSRMGLLDARAVTVIGRVWCERVGRIADSIVWGRRAAPGGTEPLRVERLQEGHLCFSWIPPEARAPARHRCVPEPMDPFEPRFTSLRYGDAAYGQLRRSNRPSVTAGAGDEAEMGVFHDLHQPLRETNLRARLSELLRAGMDAELIFAS